MVVKTSDVLLEMSDRGEQIQQRPEKVRKKSGKLGSGVKRGLPENEMKIRESNFLNLPVRSWFNQEFITQMLVGRPCKLGIRKTRTTALTYKDELLYCQYRQGYCATILGLKFQLADEIQLETENKNFDFDSFLAMAKGRAEIIRY